MELENARLFVTSAQGILARIWVISELMSELGFPANMGMISYDGFNCISQNLILIISFYSHIGIIIDLVLHQLNFV